MRVITTRATGPGVTLPREWVRGPQWLSDEVRSTWEPVLRQAQAAWQELEVASVTEGLRDAALVHLTSEEVPQAARDCSGVGLELSVLAFTGSMFRAAVHRPGAAAAWHRAWAAGDDDEIGARLGFPTCCRAWFRREWAERGSSDPTPAMATVDGPWEASILLRWLGVRLVPHLPCSGTCEPTVGQARAYLEAGRRMGLSIDALEALLRLPVTYSALNGVAIVETPFFRLMASCDATPEPVRRSRAGRVIAVPAAPEPDAWTDNGFETELAMRAAHDVVVSAILYSGFRSGSVLDLGCGDGSLLEAVRQQAPGARCAGVEADEGRARRGQRRHPRLSIQVGRIEDVLEPSDLVLLMPGRLLEMRAADAANVRSALSGARRLVVYAYGDHLQDGLQVLAGRAGIEVAGPVHRGVGVQAAEGRIR